MADALVTVDSAWVGELGAVSLVDLPAEALDRFHRDLMEQAFSPEELMTVAELDEARAAPGTEGIVLLRGERPVAGMITEDYLGGSVRLLAYLVVDVAERNRGIGAELIDRLIPARPGGLIVAEIDDPRFHPANDRADPIARVRFYDRLGSRLLPLPYVQPSLRPGSTRVDGMLLITVGAVGADVDSALIADFLEEYFFACEDPAALAADPAYQALRAAAMATPDGRLPLFPLTELTAARPGREEHL
jgi:GNAT superfamily N-acetyltransferase